MTSDGLAGSAAKFRDGGLAAVIENRLRGQLSPLCRGALIEALGAQREPARMAAIEREFSCLDRHGFVEGAVFRALAAYRSEDAAHVCINRIKSGAVSYRALPAALQALGSLYPYVQRALQERIGSDLGKYLRHPLQTVRQGGKSCTGRVQKTRCDFDSEITLNYDEKGRHEMPATAFNYLSSLI